MKYRLLVFAFLTFCFSTSSYAIFFAGEITTSDAIAEDPGFGDFYFDLYSVTVEEPMLVEVFMVPTGPFLPWLGLWDGDFSALPDYDTPPPEAFRIPGVGRDQLYLAFDALPGIEYQLMAATFEYNPTDLGTYNFFITEPQRRDIGLFASIVSIEDIQRVPAPPSLIIMALGLISLGLAKKYRIPAGGSDGIRLV